MTITDSRPAMEGTASNRYALDAPNSRSARHEASPLGVPPGGLTSTGRQARIDTQNQGAAGLTSPAAPDAAMPLPVPPQGNPTTGGHGANDALPASAAGSDVPDPAAIDRSMTAPVSLLDPALALAADILDDLERVWIANENRLRQLTRTGEDADGEERGFGLDESHPDVARLAAMVDTLAKVEHDATLNLQRKLRKHPLGAWVKAQRGIGEKQGARLLAAIGDPYINSAKGSPRTVSALWAYCGLHVLPASQLGDDSQDELAGGDQLGDPGPNRVGDHEPPAGVAAKRRKGVRSNWSGDAKMRAYLVAESCMKQLDKDCRDGHTSREDQSCRAVPAQDDAGRCGQSDHDTPAWIAAPACACSPYRVVYDARRAHTAVSHPEWTDGHSHNDALRIAAKEILKDLWRAARDYHHGAAA